MPIACPHYWLVCLSEEQWELKLCISNACVAEHIGFFPNFEQALAEARSKALQSCRRLLITDFTDSRSRIQTAEIVYKSSLCPPA